MGSSDLSSSQPKTARAHTPEEVKERIGLIKKKIRMILKKNGGMLTSAQIGRTISKDQKLNPDGKSEAEMIPLCGSLLDSMARSGVVKKHGPGWMTNESDRASMPA